MDACDAVMDKVGSLRGLIRYASLDSIQKGQQIRFTARMAAYAVVLAGLITLFLVLVLTRPAVEAIFLRAPGALFQETAPGRVENLYTLKLVNKTMRDLPVELKLENLPGKLEVMGGANIVVPAARLTQTSVLIELDTARLSGASTKVKVGVYSQGKLLQRVNTVFIGPRPKS
jgi:polyferredoxin